MIVNAAESLDVRVSRRGLTYSDRGIGPAVLLLHGWCLNRRLWDYQEETIAQRGRVIAPDLAGFGDSSALTGPYELDRHAGDVNDLLDELGVDDAIVVGFAFGAAVAMTMDRQDSSRLRRLLLIGVPSAAAAPYTRMPRAMRRDWPQFARLSAEAICKTAHSQDTMASLGAMFGATRLPVAIATVGVLAGFEPVPVAGALTTPSVFVHGALDDVVPPSISEQCAAAASSHTVEIVADSGHLVPLDGRERLDEILASL